MALVIGVADVRRARDRALHTDCPAAKDTKDAVTIGIMSTIHRTGLATIL